MSKKFPEHRLLKTWQSFYSIAITWADNIMCCGYAFATRPKANFKAPTQKRTHQLLIFFVLVTPRQIKQMLDKSTLKLIMRILWSEPWKAVLMNFSADTLIFFVDLETGHRSIFNPLLLFCAKKSSLKYAGTRARFLFYNSSFLKHQENTKTTVINSVFSKMLLSWVSLTNHWSLYVLIQTNIICIWYLQIF